MNSLQVIATYEAILATTNQMLEAAINNDWDRLVALEQDCKQLVEELIAQHHGQPLSGQFQQRKAQLIRQVLADDAKIRNITEPWMARLQTLLASSSRERKLCQAYSPDSRT